ncbi:MAG: hypothetical protein A2Z96_01525 [Spirochaetes bacterium GWB1_48_6]|nr:MAG: hypothetical protein A2Z96_01525 [Spirochaetes bacterium GWB1_48_6]
MDYALGAVFTPPPTALWGAEISGLLDLWIQGGRILDPTCGSGNLLLALVEGARNRGLKISQEMISRLYGMERDPQYLSLLTQKWQQENIPPIPKKNLVLGDFLTLAPPDWPPMEGIFSNPPWITFADLPPEHKEMYRPLFLEFNLVKNKKSVLWGSSRVDLAALIWIKVLKNHLAPQGIMGIFAPLSLFLNPGAHREFRRELADHIAWKGVWDWGQASPFPQVATRCAFYALEKSPSPSQVIPYYTQEPISWELQGANPWPQVSDSWLVGMGGKVPDWKPVILPPGVRCRQGVNTSGANEAFIFDFIPPGEAARYFFPLADPETSAPRYIFLPYRQDTGKILPAEIIQKWEADPWFQTWSNRWKETLTRRKGPMIKVMGEKGYWWQLLGVGPYTFKPWKILWKAFGSRNFNPVLLGNREGKPVIPFQALQAYLSFDTEKEALRVLEKIRELPIQEILNQSRILDGKSGAQPGRMSPFFQYS